MSTPENIAQALSRIQEITKINKGNIIRSQQMLRADRELLMRMQWIQEIIKGWYLLVKPTLVKGDSSVWYANFWDFLRIYLNVHFKDQYCLSAENSLDLHSGSSFIPKQVIVISSKGGGVPRGLPYDTSLFIYADLNNIPSEKTILQGLQVMSLPYALCKVPAIYFQKNSKEAEIALQLIRTASDLSEIILKYNFKSAAVRLFGALRFLGKDKMADAISHALEEAAPGQNIEPFIRFITEEMHSSYSI